MPFLRVLNIGLLNQFGIRYYDPIPVIRNRDGVKFDLPRQNIRVVTRANTSFDAGVYYTDRFNTDLFIMRPEAGLTVNNIGSYLGRRSETISATDQIAISLGAGLHILEVLSFRYGTLSGADHWLHARQSWGAGIDFNYISFNITGINYKSEASWDKNSRLIFYEMAVSIPFTLLIK